MSEKKGTRCTEPLSAEDVDQSRRKFVTRVGKLAYQAPIAISFSLAMSKEAAASFPCLPVDPDILIPPEPGCPH